MGHIIRLLEDKGDEVLTAKIDLYPEVLSSKVKEHDQVFFHQPFSHLCCLLYVLRKWSLRKNFCCVLHEASNYNVGVASPWRALLGTVMRRIVIGFCQLAGVRIRGVSAYVCSTYGLPWDKVSYLHLFQKRLANQSLSNIQRSEIAVVWLRRGGSVGSAEIISHLYCNASLSKVVVLGDKIECDALLDILSEKSFSGAIEISDEKYQISEDRFFHVLQSARWFISIYPREGFGLSAFQAAYFGCVIVAPNEGALAEWVPSANYEINEKLRQGKKITSEELLLVSSINSAFAQDYIKNEN